MNMLPFFSHSFAAVDCTPKSFLGIPPWYQYLSKSGQLKAVGNACSIGHFSGAQGLGTDIGLVALGILDILLHVAGFAAVIFVIYGGIQYITSQGEPDRTKHAQNTIINAFVGLVITIIAANVVSFIGNKLGG